MSKRSRMEYSGRKTKNVQEWLNLFTKIWMNQALPPAMRPVWHLFDALEQEGQMKMSDNI